MITPLISPMIHISFASFSFFWASSSVVAFFACELNTIPTMPRGTQQKRVVRMDHIRIPVLSTGCCDWYGWWLPYELYWLYCGLYCWLLCWLYDWLGCWLYDWFGCWVDCEEYWFIGCCSFGSPCPSCNAPHLGQTHFHFRFRIRIFHKKP